MADVQSFALPNDLSPRSAEKMVASDSGGCSLERSIISVVLHISRAHHTLAQMALLALKLQQEIFSFPRSMAPESITIKDAMARSLRLKYMGWSLDKGSPWHGWPSAYEPSRISANQHQEDNKDKYSETEEDDYYDALDDECSDSRVDEDGITEEADGKQITWVVASAVPHHVTGNSSLLSRLTTYEDRQGFAQAGDGASMPMQMQARGHGSIITDEVVLHDVWFIPGFSANLVSATQLAELGCSVTFARDKCYIRTEEGTLVGKAHVGRKGGLYELDFLKMDLLKVGS